MGETDSGITGRGSSSIEEGFTAATAVWIDRACRRPGEGKPVSRIQALVFETGGAHFGEQGLGCNAQFFGGASFVPTTFTEGIFEQDALDVELRAGGDVFETASP